MVSTKINEKQLFPITHYLAMAPGPSSTISASTNCTKAASTGELHMNHKKQKLQDDDSVEEDGEHNLTTPEGQMAMNPKLTAKAAGTEAKREYNRRNAARARKRNKHHVGGLEEKVYSLTKRTEDLQRSNDVLQAQVEVLQRQNQVLLVSRNDPEPKAQAQSSSSNDIMSQFLEQLQGKSETQQGQDISQLLNSLSAQDSSSQHYSTLQGGQQAGGNFVSGMQGQGNSQLLSALLNQSQAQQQSNNQTGFQGQDMSQLLGTFGFQGQPQQQQQHQHHQQQQQSHSMQQQQQQSHSMQQQQQQQSQSQQQSQQQQQQQQQVSGATPDQQQLQQLLSSMPPEALYDMIRKSS
jgi:hypothetical protein